jgi:hypothetical protein
MGGLNLCACGWEAVRFSIENGKATVEFHKMREFSGIAKEHSRSRN